MLDQTIVPRRSRRAVLVLLPLIAVALIGATLYATLAPSTKAVSAACRNAQAVASRLDPLARGEVAAFSAASASEPLPVLAFKGPNDAPLSLADFQGRTVLLNLWATWCVPCRQEMPALDRLQAALGGPRFQVVAVNIDTTRLEKPQKFLDETGVKSLTFYRDSTADVFETLRTAGRAVGLPTSILVDPKGCEIGTLAGGAAWNSDDAKALIRSAAGS